MCECMCMVYHKETGLCNSGGWLSKSKVCKAGR